MPISLHSNLIYLLVLFGKLNAINTFNELITGNADILHKYGVPVGGDQLTRVRLQEAKTLRSLSVTPEKRYDHLHPIVCEMWHSKQDLLEVSFSYQYK